MKQRKINIPALLLLFTFLFGTIGVNVSKVYCHRCQKTYSHVMFIPADVLCPCTHGENCCQACHIHKKNCDNAKRQHTYYKVYGEWAVSYSEIQFNDMLLAVDVTSVFASDVKSIVKSFYAFSLCTANSPPLEKLCTFRC